MSVAFYRPIQWAGSASLDVIFVGIFLGVWRMNQRAAQCLQRSIDELSDNQN